MTSLRSIERTLVCQRAQAVALPLAVDFVERWELALSRDEPTPDPIDFVLAVARADIPVIRSNPVLHYIEQCERDNRVPDVDRMVMALVHGFAQSRLSSIGKLCRCPVRRLLVHDPRP